NLRAARMPSKFRLATLVEQRQSLGARGQQAPDPPGVIELDHDQEAGQRRSVARRVPDREFSASGGLRLQHVVSLTGPIAGGEIRLELRGSAARLPSGLARAPQADELKIRG